MFQAEQNAHTKDTGHDQGKLPIQSTAHASRQQSSQIRPKGRPLVSLLATIRDAFQENGGQVTIAALNN
jgi:hypothetical protein